MLLTSVCLSVRLSVLFRYCLYAVKMRKNEFLSFIPQNYVFFSVQKKNIVYFWYFCLKFLMLTCFTHYDEKNKKKKIPFDSVKYCNRGLNINTNIFQIIIKFLNVMTYKENKKKYFTDTFFKAKKKHMYLDILPVFLEFIENFLLKIFINKFFMFFFP